MTSAPPLRRPLILASIMAASFMIAIEATIVSTAMPQIVAHLGDLKLYSWVFSSFLLAQAATTVLFGKLADIYGRKATLLVGLAIFVGGSILCGFAWSMLSLIAFRLVQGLGAGAVQPVAITVVGDLYPAHERGKVTGYLASVWGISSILGPLAGGLIIQHASWAWIFWINVPLGIAAALGFFLFLREDLTHQRRSVDVIGAVLFTVVVSSLMLALTEAGSAGGRTSGISTLVCIASSILFVAQERRAAEPMISFALWGRRVMATANLATLCSGMALIGLTTFLPMYVQAVLNRSALVAGFTLTVVVLGWPIGSTIAARNFRRFGLRPLLLFGAILLPIGSLAFLVLRPGMSPLLPAAGSLLMGFGMGFVSTTSTVIIQDSVGWAERGVATASLIFARNLGSTLGAAVLGAMLNVGLLHGPVPVSSAQIRALLDHRVAATGDFAVRSALDQALHLTFFGIIAVSVATLLFALLVPHVTLTEPARADAA